MAVAKMISNLLQMMEENSDQRTTRWLFVQSPVPVILVTALYFGVVYFGPRFMATRPAFQLKNVLRVYNVVLVSLSVWMAKEFALASIFNPGFDPLCQLVDYTEDPMAVKLATVIWWFYFSKIIELLDTVFFILRRKNNQVSFLHVYHHSTVPFLMYVAVRYFAGGLTYFGAMVNSFIHVLMYGYYFLSAFGPRMQPYLWWKQYLTMAQLVQFIIIILHTTHAYVTGCTFNRVCMLILVLYCTSQCILFSNFFYHTYIAKKGKNQTSIKTN